jgi:hypothetical protein
MRTRKVVGVAARTGWLADAQRLGPRGWTPPRSMPRHDGGGCWNDGGKKIDDALGYASKLITYVATFAGLSTCTLETIADGNSTIKVMTTVAMVLEYIEISATYF